VWVNILNKSCLLTVHWVLPVALAVPDLEEPGVSVCQGCGLIQSMPGPFSCWLWAQVSGMNRGCSGSQT
jgi:hypothetical protein